MIFQNQIFQIFKLSLRYKLGIYVLYKTNVIVQFRFEDRSVLFKNNEREKERESTKIELFLLNAIGFSYLTFHLFHEDNL